MFHISNLHMQSNTQLGFHFFWVVYKAQHVVWAISYSHDYLGKDNMRMLYFNSGDSVAGELPPKLDHCMIWAIK